MISKDKEILAAEENLKWKKRAYSDLSKRLKDNDALSTRAMKKFSDKQKIIQEQAKLIKEKERDSTKRLADAENLHETLLTPAMNKVSEKEKIIQEQADRKFCQLKKILNGKGGLIHIC